MFDDPRMVNPQRTPINTLLSASVFPPISQLFVLSKTTVDSPTLLPWKNFWAEELPVAWKTGSVCPEYSVGSAQLHRTRTIDSDIDRRIGGRSQAADIAVADTQGARESGCCPNLEAVSVYRAVIRRRSGEGDPLRGLACDC